MIHVATATLDDLAYVASWMCDLDRQELAVTRDPDDYEGLALDAFASTLHHVALDAGGRPIFAFGAYPVDSRTAHVWGFKTKDGPRAIHTVTKFLVREMIPKLRRLGVNRAVCYVHSDNTPSRKWLAHLGFVPRATPGELGTPLILYQRDYEPFPDERTLH